jgi:hypothetical protein
MPRPDTCDWWVTTSYPEGEIWHTECGQCLSTPVDQQLATAVYRAGADYCPWCGGEWGETSYDEIIADAIADEEYREGVRYGLYGY